MYVPKGALLRCTAAALSAAIVGVAAVACSVPLAPSSVTASRTGSVKSDALRLPVALTRAPSPAVSVLAGGAADVLTAEFAAELFATSTFEISKV